MKYILNKLQEKTTNNFSKGDKKKKNSKENNIIQSSSGSVSEEDPLDDHFKYIKILLDYNIIDFTCKNHL